MKGFRTLGGNAALIIIGFMVLNGTDLSPDELITFANSMFALFAGFNAVMRKYTNTDIFKGE